MKYRVLVLDLDGTLTNSRKEITDKTKTALQEYQRQGGIVILASGRPAYGIWPLAKELELDQFGGYILAFNGGQITDCRSQKILKRRTIPKEMNGVLYRLAKENQVVILTYGEDCLITENPEDQYVKEEVRINRMEARKVNSFTESVNSPVEKFLMVGDGDYLAGVEVRVKEAVGGNLSICRSAPFFLEIMPEGIDKSVSLKWLMEYLELGLEELAACGDGFNDLSMIEAAGLGIAMANGQECVKAAADVIAPSNDEDGVAWAVTQLLIS